MDLDKCNETWEKLDWKKSGNGAIKEKEFSVFWRDSGLCGVKYRYSPYYGCDVVVATSSSGMVYIFDYESGEMLFSMYDSIANNVDISLYNAHSAEILPNGDLVVATSGYAEGGAQYENGGLHYYPAGSTERVAFLSLPFAHAVLWDDENQWLWAVGFEGVVGVDVISSGARASLEKIEEVGCKKSKFTGHDMVPAFGMDGKYWVSDNNQVYLFDSVSGTLTRSKEYFGSAVKGMAYFEDGTMVQSTWSKYLSVYTTTPESNYKPKKTRVSITNQVYKVHTFTKDYS